MNTSRRQPNPPRPTLQCLLNKAFGLQGKATINNIASSLMMLTTLALAACSTLNLGVYDKTVPTDQLVELHIASDYTVTAFDGKPVEWKGKGAWSSKAVIQVPPGKHEISYAYHVVYGGITEAGGIKAGKGWVERTPDKTILPSTTVNHSGTVTANFLAGQKYRLTTVGRMQGGVEVLQ